MPARNEKELTIFVTGASGSLGRNLIRKLIEQGKAVRALVLRKEMIKDLPQGTIPFVGRIEDAHVIEEACKDADIVYHFAAIVGDAGAKTEELIRVNVDGTKVILEACRKNGIRQLVFPSTVDVYGRKRSETLKEESKLLPTDKYGYSKLFAEQEIIKSGVPYTIFRIAAIYGPDTSFETKFFKMFKAIKEGKVVIVGDGNNHLALVHIKDVVNCMLLAENNPKAIGKIYNLTDGNPYTQQQLLSLGADLLRVERPKRHVPEFIVRTLARQRNLDSDELRFLSSDRVIDITKVQKELGFKPSVDMKDGGREMVNMFLAKINAK